MNQKTRGGQTILIFLSVHKTVSITVKNIQPEGQSVKGFPAGVGDGVETTSGGVDEAVGKGELELVTVLVASDSGGSVPVMET